KECLLKVVNMGHDTDTVAAVAGGLAGLYYGVDAIPKDWLGEIMQEEYVEDLCEKARLLWK
ncbi:MAG: ADP-ribosylglycohydrolase family protein, partial [Anaerovoracaceae bacterium]